MKTKSESFEDIVFENRNKNYGAYELRRHYFKRGTIAFMVSISCLFFAVGMPLIANMMDENDYLAKIEQTISISLVDIPDEKEKITPPPPPVPEIQIHEIRFSAPQIVDSITDPFLGMDIIDLAGYINAPVDTNSHVIEKIEIVKNDLDSAILDIPDLTEMPRFEGGDAALIRYIAEHAKYPVSAQEQGIEGTVYIRFVVTRTGKIGDVKVLRSADPLLDDEALKVVKLLPAWTPGKKNGYPVNVWFVIPVKFRLH
jgi:protein TonB